MDYDDTPITVPRSHQIAVLLMFSVAGLMSLAVWLLGHSSTPMRVCGAVLLALGLGAVALGAFTLVRGYAADAERELSELL